jgi:hypothetical protein
MDVIKNLSTPILLTLESAAAFREKGWLDDRGELTSKLDADIAAWLSEQVQAADKGKK